MINKIKTLGKFLDQPILISKLDKSMPKIMLGGGVFALGKIGKDIFEKKDKSQEEKKQEFTNKALVLTFAIISSLLAPKIASKLTKRNPLESYNQIVNNNKKIINEYIKNNNLSEKTKKILDKAKEKTLNYKEVEFLINNSDKNFINKLIPNPDNIQSKDIFKEIGYLSIYGATSVVGGILGGVGADIITKEDYKKRVPDKINEGIYQYLANIFMCNIGAGGALAILEKLNIDSKGKRALGMTLGIILTGVVGGSKIANLISKKLINPLQKEEPRERKPELVDLGLHTDDIATVSLLSGLKWIEPALPVLYSVSGYKSGIGYRN